MKVLVVNNAVPFVHGGAEELALNLVKQLNAMRGVESELLRLPFKWTPSERLIEEVVIHRALQLYNVDRVVALKFPAYLTRHPQKVLWVLHQFRQAYDLGEVGQGLADEGRDATIKGVVHRADAQCFAESRAIYVNSPVTQARMARFNGVASEVLYPPLNDGELFGGGEPEGYVFAGGRVTEAKRQHLLIEAMAYVPGSGRLIVAGPVDSPAYADRLRKTVEDFDLGDRVWLHLGLQPRAAIARWVNGALGCAYLPFDEDSLGYVTMEAFAAGKPVITTTDSGGLLQIVSEESGWVSAPDAPSLGAALAALFDDAAGAGRRGRAARDRWAAMGVTWPKTLERLLS